MSNGIMKRAGLAVAIVGTLFVAVTTAEARDCGRTVTVALGETLRDIARRCDTTADAIVAANPDVPRLVMALPGTRLRMPPRPLPADVISYTVRRGDTLLSIARANGLTIADIIRLNPDIDAASLRSGDVVLLPADVAPPSEPTMRYTVRSGDTLRSIARDNDIRVSDIVRLNPGIDQRTLRRGDILLLPADAAPPSPPTNTVSYTVKRGETIDSIARDNGTTVAEIMALNPGLDGSRLRRGDVILLRTGVVPPTPPAGPAATVNPASGAPGLTVRVNASGFPASRQLNLLAGATVSSLQKFQTVKTDTKGAASMSVVIPDWAAGPGTLVFAFETTDGRLRAVTDTFRVAVSPPAPTTVRVTGTLTREGVECQAMRGDDGKLYTLTARNLGDFRAGDRVRVDGTIADATTCQQGITIAVTKIGAAPQ